MAMERVKTNQGLRGALLCVLGLLLSLSGCADDQNTDRAADAGPLGTDLCLNSADIAIANALPDVPDGGFPDAGRADGLLSAEAREILRALVSECGYMTCLNEIFANSPELDPCMAGCIDMTAATGLSSECTSCYVGIIQCAMANCAVECVGSDMSICDACLAVSCIPRFYECTGFDPAS